MPAVTLHPGNHAFRCHDDETILTAALRAGLLIPYGCRNGACGSCKSTLVNGAIDYGLYQASTLTEAEKRNGQFLPCVAKPLGDITMQAREVRAAGDIAVRTLPCRIEQLERVVEDVMIVRLKLPTNQRLAYRAGQYVDLLLPGDKRRSFSMANPPHDDALLELHIRHTPGGLFTDRLFGCAEPAIKVRDILRFEGPHGSFFLREQSDKPIILLASGTGFAPIKAIVEHAFYVGIERPMTLYWGGRRPRDLYLDHLARAWEAKHPGRFRYIPVVSDALPEDSWHGRTGFVHRAVMEDWPDLSGYEVYACGAPIVVESARREFTSQCGLPEHAFFADSFELAAASGGE
ncbi:MAG: CDP-6-deoxy-delta-3,4-glucoseen reductase [Casimicrobiaceae bacterium]|nr:CDP-6-deoxy-delta-3,4-glucoseen reductase [Casimicrobiaceae bacterium]MCX8097663.1 CDP-6-deoxy-delta-3,4-glucoseen reductase [Casimicrobiaceae bacterium]MDW8312255.1 CDP-6-deoxy-delta-3,4-glucoseen reductase [Burkholderiales bacterium]